MSHTLTLDIPRAWWWSANDRLHWAQRAKRTRWIRQAAALAAREASLPTFQQVAVCAWIGYPRGGRADPSNVASTVLKAAIDGLTDAGIWPDDDSRHVVAVEVRRDAPTGRTGMYRIRLVLTEEKP